MSCPDWPVVSYNELAQRLMATARAGRIPIMGTLEITYRCNNACVHCYCNLPPADPPAKASEMSLGQVCSIIDQVVEEGCLHLIITGGEPLLRPDLLDIYLHAKRRGLLISLFTNGTLITPEIADCLAEYPPFGVEISLYGRTKETYESVTRVPGSYERCIAGIELLVARKIKLYLKSVALKLNWHEIPAMKAYARQLGAGFRFDPLITSRKDNLPGDPRALRLTPEEVVQLDRDPERLAALLEFDAKFGKSRPTDALYTCGGGLIYFGVTAHGMLGTCISAQGPQYDLLAGSFQEGWHVFMPQVRAQKRTRFTACQACEIRSLCGQCPAWAQGEHGDSETPVDYLCQVAALRYQLIQANRSGGRQHG